MAYPIVQLALIAAALALSFLPESKEAEKDAEVDQHGPGGDGGNPDRKPDASRKDHGPRGLEPRNRKKVAATAIAGREQDNVGLESPKMVNDSGVVPGDSDGGEHAPDSPPVGEAERVAAPEKSAGKKKPKKEKEKK